jgi:phage terminase large subunit-like protein
MNPFQPKDLIKPEYWHVTIGKFNEVEKQYWKEIETRTNVDKYKSNLKRQFLQRFYQKHFDSFIYLLGYRDLGQFHINLIEEISQIRILKDEASRRLWLWSRGFFKTSLIIEAHSIWLIVNNPDIRILLTSNTISVAQAILRNIKNQFIANKDFRRIFYEWCPEPNEVGKIEFGTTEEFTVRNRIKSNLKEPTMKVSGIGTNLTGCHFDYIKCDDLVTRDSVTNDSQIIASKEYYSSLRQLFDKAAVPREDVVGTIYHFNDLYCDLRKSGGLKESFVPARIEGKAVFPERLPDDELNKLVADASVGPYQFQTQYMLNPIDPKEAKFKEEWLSYYDEIPFGCAQYILCDPASTQKKKSDYTVIERWGISNNGTHYLLEGIRDKLTAFERIDKLFEFVKHSNNLKWVSYEVLGGRHGDLEIISQRQQTEKLFFFVKETKATTQSKVDRIEQRLVPIYHNRTVKLPKHLYFRSQYDGKTYNFVELLKLEYLQFPFSEHDDILDCQSQIMQEQLIPGNLKPIKRESQGMTGDDLERYYDYVDGYNRKYKDPQVAKNMMFMDKIKRLVRRSIV